MRGLWKSLICAYSNLQFEWGLGVAFWGFGVAIVLVMRAKKKNLFSFSWKEWLGIIIFSLYMVLLLGGTLLCRDVGEICQIELRLFWSYWETFVKHNQAIWQQMLYNVLIFIPWGTMVPFLFGIKRKEWVIGSAIIFSIAIECTQLIFKLGLFELDDVFHNTLGTVIGCGIWVGCQKIKRWRFIRC